MEAGNSSPTAETCARPPIPPAAPHRLKTKQLGRRAFLASCSALLALPRAAAQPPSGRRTVILFLRGGADGLSIVVPHGDRDYYRARPTIAVPARDVIDLDGYFGLHPALAPLQWWWDNGSLAVAPAAGIPGALRTHIDAERHLRHTLHDLPPAVSIVELGGWDTHFNQTNQLAIRLPRLARQIERLAARFRERRDDVTIVLLSEFGRTVRENGNGGTDHGRATAMLTFGATVAGGIVGAWPGLDGADVAVSTDYSHTLA